MKSVISHLDYFVPSVRTPSLCLSAISRRFVAILLVMLLTVGQATPSYGAGWGGVLAGQSRDSVLTSALSGRSNFSPRPGGFGVSAAIALFVLVLAQGAIAPLRAQATPAPGRAIDAPALAASPWVQGLRDLLKIRLAGEEDSPQYRDFKRRVEKSYGIQITDKDKDTAMMLFHDPAEHRNLFDPRHIRAVQLIFQVFPKMPRSAAALLYPDMLLLPEMTSRMRSFLWREWLASPAGEKQYVDALTRVKQSLEAFEKTFGVTFDGMDDYYQYFNFPLPMERFLAVSSTGVDAPTLVLYFQKRYAGGLGPDSVGKVLTFLKERAGPLMDLGIAPAELDRFFIITGMGLARLEVRDIGRVKTILRENWPRIKASMADGTLPRNLSVIRLQVPSVDEGLKKELENLFGDPIPYALAGVAAVNGPDLVRLLKAAAQFGGGQVPPLLNVAYADSKIHLLDSLREKVPALRGPVAWTQPDGVGQAGFNLKTNDPIVLARAQAIVDSGQAAALYETMRGPWRLEQVDLPEFLGVLLNPDLVSTFSDPSAADRFYRRVDQWHITDPFASRGWSLYSVMKMDKPILTASDTEMANAAFAAAALADRKEAEPRPAGASVDAMEFSWAFDRPSVHQADFKPYLERLLALRLTPRQITAFLNDIDLRDKGKLDRTWERLQRPAVADYFAGLQAHFKAHPAWDPVFPPTAEQVVAKLLFLAIEMSGPPEDVDRILARLASAGVRLDEKSIRQLSRYVLPNPDVRRVLMDTDFWPFAKVASQAFWGENPIVEVLPELSELFDYAQENPGALSVLSSPRFRDLARMISERYFITRFPPSAIAPLVQLAETTSTAQLKKWIREAGPDVEASDLLFLSRVMTSPALRARLRNRTALVNDVKTKIYRQPEEPRRRLDRVVMIQYQIEARRKLGQDTSILEAEKQAEQSGYTERPALDGISNLQLLRLLLTFEGLNAPGAWDPIDWMLDSDMADKTTEWGGTEKWSPAGLQWNPMASANFLPPTEDADNRYTMPIAGFLFNGDLEFHLHAASDDKLHVSANDNIDYGGPSGSPALSTVDFGQARDHHSTALVIATMGQKTMKNQSAVNLRKVAMYWVNSAGKGYVVSFGIFERPLHNPHAAPAPKPASRQGAAGIPFYRSLMRLLPAFLVALAGLGPWTGPASVGTPQSLRQTIAGIVRAVSPAKPHHDFALLSGA